jgi:hypothetical protein
MEECRLRDGLTELNDGSVWEISDGVYVHSADLAP